MFTHVSFWQIFALAAVGCFNGIVVNIAISAGFTGKYSSKNQKKISLTIVSSIILLVSAVIFWFNWPISHWLEICLLGFSVAGFALRWLGLEIIWIIDNKLRFGLDDLLAVTIGLSVPILVTSLTVSIINYYWTHYLM